MRATNDPGETLVGRKICAARWAIYCSPDFAKHWGDDLRARAPWVAWPTASAPPRGRWYEKNIDPSNLACRVNSLPAMSNFAACGVGAAILPCFIGGLQPNLVRIGAPLPELDVGLWLLTHADLRHSARVRAFMDFAGGEFVKNAR